MHKFMQEEGIKPNFCAFMKQDLHIFKKMQEVGVTVICAIHFCRTNVTAGPMESKASFAAHKMRTGEKGGWE